MRLTDLAIQKLPLREKGQRTYWDDALPGFGVRVGTRTKSYVVMYGRERRLTTICHYGEKKLSEARQEALIILAQLRVKKRSLSDSEALMAYLEDCHSRLRPATAERYGFALARHRKKIDLDTTDPNEIKALKAFFNWCIDHGYRDTNPLIRRRAQFAVRDRLLSDDEITAIYRYEHQPYSTIVRLLIHTGQRRGQIAYYTPNWLSENTIAFPAAVMKTKRAHTIPATETVQQLLTRLGPSNSWSRSKRRIDRETGVRDWVLHDIRRYFSTTMAKLGVPLHITEHIIDHRSQLTGVAEIYNRYHFLPEMREALETYESYLASIVALGQTSTEPSMAPSRESFDARTAFEEEGL